jgi:hypothetical protein
MTTTEPNPTAQRPAAVNRAQRWVQRGKQNPAGKGGA